jgi:hypothetical protein
MRANKEKLELLMKKYCCGNYNRFARELGIDPSHLYRYINSGVGGGKKLIGAVMKFCIKNQLDFEEYVEI